mgnify:CR=1 FL=1
MDAISVGQSLLLVAALLFTVSGIFAVVRWIHPPRYAETMAAFNDRLRMRYLGKLLGIAGGTLALGGVCLLLVDVLARERRLYDLGFDARTDAIVVVPRGAPVVTAAEESDRRLNELGANVKILWDNRRELAAAVKKSPLARKLVKCREIVRELRKRRVVQPDFTFPIPPPRPARVAFDEGLSRGDPGGDE